MNENASALSTESETSPKKSSTKHPRHCKYFEFGKCLKGSQCPFLHDLKTVSNKSSPERDANTYVENQTQLQKPPHHQMTPPNIFYPSFIPQSGTGAMYNGSLAGRNPAPVYINTPPGQPIFSIDVECVATSVQHTGRSVAQIALVNEWGQPVFNAFVQQEQPVVSYITPLTGITKEMLETHGKPLQETLNALRRSLPPNAILVGCNILKDIQWLQLREGVDYASLIDLSALFRVWNTQRNEYTSFSQDHCAKVWLGIMDRAHHDALTDAAISMNLFNAYRSVQFDGMRLSALQYNTLMAPRTPGFSSLNPTVDGCCMGNRKQCKCGAPFF